MFSFLNNIPQVTKNILLLNVMLFILTLFFESRGLDLGRILGAYYVNSPSFKPFQMVTHFFMHGGFMHILLNMWLLLMLGSHLERLWGPKRFFIFYLISALGAFALYNIIGAYQIFELKNSFSHLINVDALDQIIKTSETKDQVFNRSIEYLNTLSNANQLNPNAIVKYLNYCSTPMLGASGAIFGIMAAFAILLPNTEFYIYGAIPVKAKYMVGGYFLLEVYLSFNGSGGDGIAHLAHVGGAIAGAILLFIWRKTDRKNFW